MSEQKAPVTRRVAVVGAGLMGSGIAAVLLRAGYDVDLFDTAPAALERARARAAAHAGERAEALATHDDLEAAVGAADLVIEAVPEVMELKREVFARVDAAAPASAYLATNTSELSVTAIAAATRRTERVVGMHWFNPPERMRLVELVRAVRTSPEALAAATTVAEACGKTVVTVEDRQGFVTTRVVAAVLLEGARLLEEGVASREDIDTAVKLGLNHPMGPLELADYIGLDTVLLIADAMAEAYGDRFRAPQTLRKLVEAGRLGRKSGGGFYERE
ncbi:MAG TPA: 3-hydroxyacyl-CoA dehydrogenase family protein [Trueperaceae bacterium]|nr:3-hydroxyacyl-CoA dehydrogenase family protein [Trueperaceae bacterium]